MTLTNCDTHDNWPPEAFKPFVDMVKAGGLRDTLNAMLADKTIFRSPGALGPAYERPETVTDEDIETYLRPLVRTEQRTRDLHASSWLSTTSTRVAIEPQLRKLQAPTLIVWGTDDVYFPVKWAHWLAETIPGAKPPVELPGRPDLLPGRAGCRVQPTAARPPRRLRNLTVPTSQLPLETSSRGSSLSATFATGSIKRVAACQSERVTLSTR